MTGDSNRGNIGGTMQTWLVVRPDALLWALEEVETGRSAIEVMTEVLDLAHASTDPLEENE